jgi:hypothetical protein
VNKCSIFSQQKTRLSAGFSLAIDHVRWEKWCEWIAKEHLTFDEMPFTKENSRIANEFDATERADDANVKAVIDLNVEECDDEEDEKPEFSHFRSYLKIALMMGQIQTKTKTAKTTYAAVMKSILNLLFGW